MKRGAITLMLVLTAAPSGAQLLELQPGARVRISAPSILGGRLDGTVGARHGDTVSVVRQGAGAVEIPIAAMTSVAIYRGKSHGAGAIRGLIWGAAIGLPIGALAALGDNTEWNTKDVACDPDFEQCAMYSDAGLIASSIVGGVLFGAGIGAIIGRAQWDKLAVPVRSAILTPTNRGVRIGFAFQF